MDTHHHHYNTRESFSMTKLTTTTTTREKNKKKKKKSYGLYLLLVITAWTASLCQVVDGGTIKLAHFQPASFLGANRTAAEPGEDKMGNTTWNEEPLQPSAVPSSRSNNEEILGGLSDTKFAVHKIPPLPPPSSVPAQVNKDSGEREIHTKQAPQEVSSSSLLLEDAVVVAPTDKIPPVQEPPPPPLLLSTEQNKTTDVISSGGRVSMENRSSINSSYNLSPSSLPTGSSVTLNQMQARKLDFDPLLVEEDDMQEAFQSHLSSPSSSSQQQGKRPQRPLFWLGQSVLNSPPPSSNPSEEKTDLSTATTADQMARIDTEKDGKDPNSTTASNSRSIFTILNELNNQPKNSDDELPVLSNPLEVAMEIGTEIGDGQQQYEHQLQSNELPPSPHQVDTATEISFLDRNLSSVSKERPPAGKDYLYDLVHLLVKSTVDQFKGDDDDNTESKNDSVSTVDDNKTETYNRKAETLLESSLDSEQKQSAFVRMKNNSSSSSMDPSSPSTENGTTSVQTSSSSSSLSLTDWEGENDEMAVTTRGMTVLGPGPTKAVIAAGILIALAVYARTWRYVIPNEFALESITIPPELLPSSSSQNPLPTNTREFPNNDEFFYPRIYDAVTPNPLFLQQIKDREPPSPVQHRSWHMSSFMPGPFLPRIFPFQYIRK